MRPDTKADVAQDIRDIIHRNSDDEAKLETLEHLSRLDLTVLYIALDSMEGLLRTGRPR